jgi:uncharacterized protein with HEPN domain
MSASLVPYLQQIQAAAEQARRFTVDMTESEFTTDIRTQMAVGMALVQIGAAAERIGASFPEFVQDHPEIPWVKMSGMRNLLEHDYCKAEIAVIWHAAQTVLPSLISKLEDIRHWRAEGE